MEKKAGDQFQMIVMYRARTITICILLICLLFPSCGTMEVLWGDIPLSVADPVSTYQVNSDIRRCTIINDATQLKYGEVFDIDLVDDYCIIEVGYDRYIQLWIMNISGEFLEGYEIDMLTNTNSYGRQCRLSPDGSVLLRYYTSKHVLGVSKNNDTAFVTVYDFP